MHLSEGLHPPDVGLGHLRERQVTEHLAHLLLGVGLEVGSERYKGAMACLIEEAALLGTVTPP